MSDKLTEPTCSFCGQSGMVYHLATCAQHGGHFCFVGAKQGDPGWCQSPPGRIYTDDTTEIADLHAGMYTDGDGIISISGGKLVSRPVMFGVGGGTLSKINSDTSANTFDIGWLRNDGEINVGALGTLTIPGGVNIRGHTLTQSGLGTHDYTTFDL